MTELDSSKINNWDEFSRNIEEFFKTISTEKYISENEIPTFFEVLEKVWQIDFDPENLTQKQTNESWYNSFRKINASWNIQFQPPNVSGTIQDEKWKILLQQLNDLSAKKFSNFEIKKPEIGKKIFSTFYKKSKNVFHRLIMPYIHQILSHQNNVLIKQQEFNNLVVQLQNEIIMRLIVERQVSFNAEIVRLINQIVQNILFSRQKRFNMITKELLKIIPSTIEQNFKILDNKIDAFQKEKEELTLIRDSFNRFLTSAAEKEQTKNISETKVKPSKTTFKIDNISKVFQENLYLKFENMFRGSQKNTLISQKKYLSYFSSCNNVADIGCGRGEFLQLLNENNIGSFGVDINSLMINICKKKNLNVILEDAFDFLRNKEDKSLDGIFSAQFIEHFSSKEILNFISLCHTKLQDDAYLIIETPNPKSITVGATTFHRDLTHKQLYHPDTLKFLFSQIGFHDVICEMSSYIDEKNMLKELPENTHIEQIDPLFFSKMKYNINYLNQFLFAPQDYAIIGRK